MEDVYVVAAASGSSPAAGQASISDQVDGKCNIFGAGLVVSTRSQRRRRWCFARDAAPRRSRLRDLSSCWLAPAASRLGSPSRFDGPDGGTSAGGATDVLSYGGIAGLVHGANRTLFLTGVFLGPGPASSPAPPRLDVTNANDESAFSPLWAQTFFMGDGRDASSNMQRFNIPAGRQPRLFLGFVDAFDFGNTHQSSGPLHGDDNGGSFRVETNIIPAPGVRIAARSGGRHRLSPPTRHALMSLRRIVRHTVVPAVHRPGAVFIAKRWPGVARAAIASRPTSDPCVHSRKPRSGFRWRWRRQHADACTGRSHEDPFGVWVVCVA
jgi:hypothetical protein